MTPDRERFTCVICNTTMDVTRAPFWKPRYRHLPPVCHSCECGVPKQHGYTTRRGIPFIQTGYFMDKRHAYQIAALTQAIEVEAHQQLWRADPKNRHFVTGRP